MTSLPRDPNAPIPPADPLEAAANDLFARMLTEDVARGIVAHLRRAWQADIAEAIKTLGGSGPSEGQPRLPGDQPVGVVATPAGGGPKEPALSCKRCGGAGWICLALRPEGSGCWDMGCPTRRPCPVCSAPASEPVPPNMPDPKMIGRVPAQCRACGEPLLLANLFVCDGCPCNSKNGVNFEPLPCDVCETEFCTRPGHRMALMFGPDIKAGDFVCEPVQVPSPAPTSPPEPRTERQKLLDEMVPKWGAAFEAASKEAIKQIASQASPPAEPPAHSGGEAERKMGPPPDEIDLVEHGYEGWEWVGIGATLKDGGARTRYVRSDLVDSLRAEVERLRVQHVPCTCPPNDLGEWCRQHGNLDKRKAERDAALARVKELEETVADIDKETAHDRALDAASREDGTKLMREALGQDLFNQLWGPELEMLGHAVDHVMGQRNTAESRAEAAEARVRELEGEK